ncbi:MAG TPA: lipoyl(octanoyl) transferase LipB [Pseudobdellovibrionaceae bacterium]|nr:lipoyl(octanoyl) transferase LipB [Pseudobdellovibrionaceae bacterium]
MLNVVDWGLVDYREALTRQEDLVDRVAREQAHETLIFCTHPPIVTLGRATKAGDVFGWSGDVVEVSRGGRATYHGPSQIVVYPILDLNSRGRDLHLHFRKMEEALLETVRHFGIEATGRSPQVEDGSAEAVEATGVWVGSRKLASMGVAVRKWISFHGLALNVEHDPQAFVGMKPCGFAPGTAISLEELLGAHGSPGPLRRDLVRERLEIELRRVFAPSPS